MRRVQVRWVDSCVGARWTTPEDVKDSRAARCLSVGFLVDENEDSITLAQSVGEGEDGAEEYGQPITIPRVALLGPPAPLRSEA